MARISTTLDTPFTVPLQADWRLQVDGGSVMLESENASGDGFQPAMPEALKPGIYQVANILPGARWRVVAPPLGIPLGTFKADQ